MLTNTRLDGFGQVLALLAMIAFARLIWVDFRTTKLVRRAIPDVTSRDPRKHAYLREHFSSDGFWQAEVESLLLMAFVLAVFSIIGLRYGGGKEHDVGFGWLALGGSVWCLMMLARDVMRRQRLLSSVEGDRSDSSSN